MPCVPCRIWPRVPPSPPTSQGVKVHEAVRAGARSRAARPYSQLGGRHARRHALAPWRVCGGGRVPAAVESAIDRPGVEYLRVERASHPFHEVAVLRVSWSCEHLEQAFVARRSTAILWWARSCPSCYAGVLAHRTWLERLLEHNVVFPAIAKVVRVDDPVPSQTKQTPPLAGDRQLCQGLVARPRQGVRT